MAALSALDEAKRIVIKIGSALLVDQASGRLNAAWLDGLIEDVAMLRREARDVILVSSGSIALGRHMLAFAGGALTVEQSQAAAAVGQIHLAQAYQSRLAEHGLTAAQVLLTLDDSADRRRYLNSRATFQTLLAAHVIPIVNENDTVATDEIRFGDNDRLAAQVGLMAGADLVILLSDVDGLYTADPRKDESARHLPLISEITPEIAAMGGDAGTTGAKGGMKTKIMAARTAVMGGSAMIIMLGSHSRPIQALRQGARHSCFLPRTDPQHARKHWISGMKPKGEIVIDAGAARALESGKSLLPAGVTAVRGDFERGDPVLVLSATGAEIALGLSGYDAKEATQIIGLRSQDIAAALGYNGRAALIHRDDMVL